MIPFWKKTSSTPMRHPDPDAAIAAYLEELRQAEVAGAATPAAALNGLGDAHLDKGDLVSAIDYFRQAAEVYEREGLHDSAIACCRKIRRYAPDDPEVGLMLGRYYAAKGLRADAVTELVSYAERQERLGRRREAIEALREVARLAPVRATPRERLARLLADEGQREEALEHFRAALEAYGKRGDDEAVERLELETTRLEIPMASAAPRPAAAPTTAPPPEEVSVSPPPAVTPVSDRPVVRTPVQVASGGVGLDIERTSYDTDLSPRELERASAEQHADAGRWSEAVISYRRLAELGGVAAADFATWAECARQTGEPSKLLEALAAAARWYRDHGDETAARRSAGEMLLVDPNNSVATDILEQMGTSLPRG